MESDSARTRPSLTHRLLLCNKSTGQGLAKSAVSRSRLPSDQSKYIDVVPIRAAH